MKVTIQPKKLHGVIPAIASKSCVHRLLICAALADGETIIRCRELNRDIEATAQCLAAMGAAVTRREDCYHVLPIQPVKFSQLDCGESGSTLRFLLPVLCALGQPASITMHGRLSARPLEPLWSQLTEHGAVLGRPGEDVISVGGKLSGADFCLAANVSSQYISGLLFALPLMGGGVIQLTGHAESAGYISMTMDALHAFGVRTQWEDNKITVFPGTYRTPGEVEAEGDWSNAAFWLTAGYLSNGSVLCTGLREDSSQGDRAVLGALEDIRTGQAMIDASQIPDLVPILAVAAALTPGRTEIVNAARLRLKESDRLQTVTEMINELGGSITQTQDGLIIRGQEQLRGGRTHSRNDHRIAMSAAIASIGCIEPVIIEQAEAVEKSYPGFFRDFMSLGGSLTKEESP